MNISLMKFTDGNNLAPEISKVNIFKAFILLSIAFIISSTIGFYALVYQAKIGANMIVTISEKSEHADLADKVLLKKVESFIELPIYKYTINDIYSTFESSSNLSDDLLVKILNQKIIDPELLIQKKAKITEFTERSLNEIKIEIDSVFSITKHLILISITLFLSLLLNQITHVLYKSKAYTNKHLNKVLYVLSYRLMNSLLLGILLVLSISAALNL